MVTHFHTMSTSVCQEVRARFDPWVMEPHFFHFKLAHPGASKLFLPHNFDPDPKLHSQQQETLNTQNNTQNNKSKNESCNETNMKSPCRNRDLGGWSFLQAFSNLNSTQNAKGENEKVYVHPLVKRSASMLSEKSLEMCTESLGSETGSSLSENGDDIISLTSLCESEKSSRVPCFGLRKRSSHIRSFPPPLTTIRGPSGGGVEVKSEREDGRLLVKAVSVGTHQSCFKAERSDGRLRLLFLHDSCLDDVEEFYDHDFYGDLNDCDNDDDVDFDDHDDEFDGDKEGEGFGEDMEGNNGNVGGELWEANQVHGRRWRQGQGDADFGAFLGGYLLN